MVNFSETSPPPLGRLRVANAADILRLGIVCPAGYRYAEQFTWERPCHAEHPQSAINCFRHEIKEFIESPEHVVLVSEDEYETEESSKTEAVIPDNNGWTAPETGARVVVGVVVWKLNPGSSALEKYQPTPGDVPVLPEYDKADLDEERAAKVVQVCEAAEHEHLSSLSSLERIVVHPAYWNRGHGTRLTQWGIELANTENIKLGVLASNMGSHLFQCVGFTHITDVHVEGDSRNKEGIDIAVLRYEVPVSSIESWSIFDWFYRKVFRV